ncbi:nuclear transport factor 2 family protein [Paraburkholderia sediminicola]|uniref:nuclear transport factor 2 family protein n=1 Tax=Paraburkholderia sediminicola TaxID=458836 RepID=UPI0038BDFAFF
MRQFITTRRRGATNNAVDEQPIQEQTQMTSAGKYVLPSAEQLANAQKVVQRFAAEWQNPVADNLRVLMHEDTQNLIPPMTEPADREGVVEHFRQVLAQLPDLKVDVLQWAPTGDAVMIEWRASATVAGQALSWQGVDRFNVRGDRMYKGQVYWDTRRVAEQMAEAVKRAQQSSAAG